MNFSLVEQKNNGQPRARNYPKDGDRSKIHVLMETSQAERHAGINVSYENSFSAIKKDILKETVDK